jgi:hypothetical protein
MAMNTVSPWSYESLALKSPDGKWTASMDDASEIAMGAPCSGTLKLSNGQTTDNCSPSIVWSEDSRYLAVPQWTKDRMQRLVIIDVVGKQRRVAPGEYRVLALESFSGGVVKGIDSPIHEPRPLAFDVRPLFE